MENVNIIRLYDSYKDSHWKCYPKNVEKVYSYMEARGGEFPTTIFFGLQYYLLKYLSGPVVTQKKIDDAEKFWHKHLGRKDVFNRKGWEHILNEHDGHLPIRIEAIPEGTEVPISTPLFTVVNTDPKCYWLTNLLETHLSKVWYPTTIATQSFYIRKMVEKLIEKTGTLESIFWKTHDFGMRGVACEEMAAIGAASHLISFMGTDTVSGIEMLENYYKSDVCGNSIPATEHCIICSHVNEEEACEHFLDTFPTGLIACVSDTFSIYNCVENIWGKKLKEKILKRDGTLVIRPDSGDYMEIVPWILNSLWNSFGGTVNDKGYRVLDSHVRVIQGDGMNPKTIEKLFNHIVDLGWSIDNLVVGSGGGLLQNVNRDTCKFAIKCSSVLRDNTWVDVFKDPITDKGKRSKAGRFQVVKFPDGSIKTVDYTYNQPAGINLLQPVFENGKVLKTYTLDEVKKNAFPN